MDNVVTLIFLVLWILVAFFVLRFFGRLYFNEPRRAEIAALAVAFAFALGSMWPYSVRFGGASPTQAGPATTAATAPAQQIVVTNVLGNTTPPGAHEVSETCRSAKGKFGRTGDGSLDDLRTDEHQSQVVVNGGRMERGMQYVVEGWAAETSAPRPARGVCLLIDGKVNTSARTYYGSMRPDLGTGFHHDELIPSGYVIVIPPDTFARGRHRIEVLARLAGGDLVMLPVARDVIVY